MNDKKYGPSFLGKATNPWNSRENECQSLWCRPLGGGPQGLFLAEVWQEMLSLQKIKEMTQDVTNQEDVPLGSFPHLHNLSKLRVSLPTTTFSLEVHTGHSVCGDCLCRDVTRPKGKYGLEKEKRSDNADCPALSFCRSLQLVMTRCRFSFQGSHQLAQLLQAPAWSSAL